MKKEILVLVMAILSIGIATAQNANHTGFFLEAGIGGLVGNTPRTNIISVTDNVMYYKCLSGAAADFGLGRRTRMSNHWAYEFKVEATIPMSNTINTLVGRCLFGFRYTSPEIWRNYSLYTHFDLGGAIVANRGIIMGHDNIIYPNTEELKIRYKDYEEGFGVAYSLGIGANITTHFYAEACLNAQAMFDVFGKNGLGMANYGVIAFLLGYRF